jgi:hypothetical protein
MPDTYDPANWYWKVGGKDGQVFSSAKPGYVSENNKDYKAWLKNENHPSGGEYMTDGELADVLLKAGLPSDVIAAAGADDFGPALAASDQLQIIQAIGVDLKSTAAPSLNAIYDISGQSWQDIRDEALYVQTFGSFSGGETSFVWRARNKEVTFDSTEKFLAVVKGLADYYTKWRQHLTNNKAKPDLGTVAID